MVLLMSVFQDIKIKNVRESLELNTSVLFNNLHSTLSRLSERDAQASSSFYQLVSYNIIIVAFIGQERTT